MSRILIWCFCASPALLASLMIWAFVYAPLAVLFMAACCFASGYIARWLDEPQKYSVRGSFLP